jgi:ubiquinone/menaquinone biosynthesis C-methylase UbiE
MARPRPDSRLLEVGCGTGNYSLALVEHSGAAVIGIDPSLPMLERARQRAGWADFRQGCAERLGLADETIELVFSVDVIHHVVDRAAYFAEAYRVLRPGGLLCTVTDSERMIYRRRPLSSHFPATVPHELRRYPPIPRLHHEMSEAGFVELIEQSVELHYPLTDAQAYRERAYSSLHLIDEADFQRGLARLEEELKAGPVSCLSLYCLLWGRKG